MSDLLPQPQNINEPSEEYKEIPDTSRDEHLIRPVIKPKSLAEKMRILLEAEPGQEV
jgi:hypothetical protein